MRTLYYGGNMVMINTNHFAQSHTVYLERFMIYYLSCQSRASREWSAIGCFPF